MKILVIEDEKKVAEIFFADLRLDLVANKVWRSGVEINLTAKEYGVFEIFMRNPNMLLSHAMIAEQVWITPLTASPILSMCMSTICAKR